MEAPVTTYLALVHTDRPGNYGVSFPDVPGCIAAGDSLEGAIENASEALDFHIEGLAEDGDPLPRPRTIHELRDDAEFKTLVGDAIVVPVALRAAVAA